MIEKNSKIRITRNKINFGSKSHNLKFINNRIEARSYQSINLNHNGNLNTTAGALSTVMSNSDSNLHLTTCHNQSVLKSQHNNNAVIHNSQQDNKPYFPSIFQKS